MMSPGRLAVEESAQQQCEGWDEATRASLRQQTRDLLEREISFIPNSEFPQEDHPKELTPTCLPARNSKTQALAPFSLPAHLARLCESDLLTADQERDLFREMNRLKFWANRLRCRLDPDQPDPKVIQRLTSYLDQAERIRNHLVKSNLRLVLSIARKFVTPRNSFDELLSDGVVCMMHAVEKFDFDRGFRFSTYAYRSISRSLGRSVARSRKQLERFDSTTADCVQDTSRSITTDRSEQQNRELLTDLVDQLDRRERFIIRSRFALGAHRKRRTCREIAERLGISKERVRQLEQRAVAKIQSMAASA